MAADYDETGTYKYPDGFDPKTNEWKAGFEEARGKWEKEYAEAQTRWEEHKKQVKVANELAAKLPDAPATPAEEPAASSSSYSSESADAGTLSADESLTALRDKLKSAE
jgi:small subunit ribosomal protein S1